MGEGNGQGDSSIHRSRTSVIRNREPLRSGRRWNSTGSPSWYRTCTGAGDRPPKTRLKGLTSALSFPPGGLRPAKDPMWR